MDPQQDPFAVFEVNEAEQMSAPRKKVHIDFTPQLDSAILANKLAGKDSTPLDSDEEACRKNKLEDIDIDVERSDEGCIHEIFYPKGYQRMAYEGICAAKKYPFNLDPFQEKSVRAIESDENVLVCAHTSAGKTAIAEYAIAVCMKKKSRVIYTSPIKALSNQKYRQLLKEFEDVGLVTGDVSINQTASCLVMTTQILRNMIYRGSQIVREVKWVIFDEVHYMRDKERGVVWEETIIMMPPRVKYVFLSATIGNPEEFACWLTKLRRQPCNVVYTDYRPVPLEHYLCPAGGDGLYLVVDDTGKFHDSNFNKAVEVLGQTVNVIGMQQKKKKNLNQGSDLSKIIKVIMERSMDPAIIFSFSKRDVEAYARSVVSKYDLTTKKQKQTINEVFENAIAVLDEVDRDLAPITSMKTIIMKGIGIHHGGLLPLVKETVEVLFQAGLIKILFSTQTFSMGVNMPAKTVVFTSARKFDGETTRWIAGGEYIQMSGRAGRRGLDKKGITILMIDEKMQHESAKSMLKGNSDNLNSAFYINYNMLLNSQRLEDIDPDFILARSLLQFQHESKLPKLLQAYKQKMEQYKNESMNDQEDLETLFLLTEKLNDLKEELRILTYTPFNVTKYLNVGRILRIKETKNDWGYGYLINFHKRDRHKKKNDETSADASSFVADILVYCRKNTDTEKYQPLKITDQGGQMLVLPFALTCIHQITVTKVSSMPSDLTLDISKKSLRDTLADLLKKPVKTIQIQSNSPKSFQLKSHMKQTEDEIKKYHQFTPQEIQNYRNRRKLYEQLKQEQKKIKELSGIVLRKEKKAYTRVMKRMGLVEKGVVTLKGNVTCQISSNHQILLTQLLFAGFFNDMNAIQIAAILTSLVHEEKAQSDRKFTKNPKLKAKLQELMNEAKKVYKVLHDCKVEIEEDEYLGSIKEQLIEVTYEWCSGATFAQLCKMTESYEGSLIRTLRRLNELLKQMCSAAKTIGNEELGQKFSQAGLKTYKGIVQAASLYTI